MQDSIQRSYPLFRRASNYAAKRRARSLFEHLRYGLERRALRACLAATSHVRSVLDVPCGMGRLFPFWLQQELRVLGVELSPAMAQVARAALAKHADSEVRIGDAFALPMLAEEKVDLVVCVRFLYYFDAEERQSLFRGFYSATNRYLLLQFKDGSTHAEHFRAWRREKRSARRLTKVKIACMRRELESELRTSGFRVLDIIRPHPFTDRSFVLAEKC